MLHRNILIRRNPLFALDSLLANFFCDSYSENHWMRSDIEETEDSFRISVDLPGVPKDRVEVSLEDGYLVVGVQEAEKDHKDEKLLRRERKQERHGQRVFQIGKGVDEENISAELAEGVLHIELAKKPAESLKRLISVE
ncbi:MAG: Hsp20 family protein [Spirochaetota bacterium]